MIFYIKFKILSLFFVLSSFLAVSALEKSYFKDLSSLPEPDGNLHLYTLPIGVGESHLIQCPSGHLTIYDLGSTENLLPDYRFMTAEDLREFIGDQRSRINNAFITHYHFDHYSFFADVFTNDFPLDGLEDFTISCSEEGLPQQIQDWVDDQDIRDKIRTLNNGDPCGPNGESCGDIILCPDDPDVYTWLLAANLGNCTYETGKMNMDSMIMKLERGDSSILMPADIDDATNDWEEDGIQKSLVDYYGDQLQSSVQTVPHHGANDFCNKPVFIEGVSAKAIVISGNPGVVFQIYMPSCDTVQRYLTTDVCNLNVADTNDPDYCGDNHINVNQTEVLPGDRIPSVFGCASEDLCSEEEDNICQFTSNEFAVYTTTPDMDTMAIIQTTLDANGKWGVQNHVTVTNVTELEYDKAPYQYLFDD